jgi:nucleotide-binding universal stress UspA family protein
MTDHDRQGDFTSALSDFHHARNQAQLKQLLSRLTGESTQLLSFDEVRQTLRLQGGIDRGIKDIPLAAIVGSVGRYTDFTRDFLPRKEINPERWARVMVAANGLVGLPPIEVYQIGNAYFVQDGNHRVSVARQMGAKYIQAYITEVHTRAPINPDVKPDELILIAEYNQFLEQTRLNEYRPEADLRVTIPGQYPRLLEHIEVHRHYMGLDLQREIPYEEAVVHWFDMVYLPVVQIIRNQGNLRHFPNRTETDLYLWIAEHRSELEVQFGLPVRDEYIAGHLAEAHSPVNTSLFSRLRDLILPEMLEGGPRPGQWREQALAARSPDRLFQEILVPVNGKEDGWCALSQAIEIARREGASLYGLHVVQQEDDLTSEGALSVQAEFGRRCQESNISGRLVLSTGEVVEQICLRASVTDLVIVNLSYPPSPQPLAKLSSGFHNLIQRCPRPVIATPQTISPLNRALLAFDGSPKAREALFIAAYLAGKWQIPLSVVTVEDGGLNSAEVLAQARNYLEEHDISAEYRMERGKVGETILRNCQNDECDFVILGGYGFAPVLEVVLGSTVDAVLRQSCQPVLVCR